MVKVEIVDEKDQQQSSPYASPSSSRTSSSVSLSSVDSDSPVDESSSIAYPLSRTSSLLPLVTRLSQKKCHLGVTTSALLIGLPLALILEDEAKVVAQENEMLAQQQGAQQFLVPSSPNAQKQGGQQGLVPPGF
ncbi:hypothetical protein BGW80DRAFT_1454545 [Lactifluus volemus]|nr:hypothetical protein BGW80DRAFT_1454545 [Lactifluus volemus]